MGDLDDKLPRRPPVPRSPKPIPLDGSDPEEEEEPAPPPRAAAPVPPKPLPRMWKAEPPPEPTSPDPKTRTKGAAREEARAEPGRTPAAKPKPAPSRRRDDDEPQKKGVLLEETPELDTYDARRKIRLVVGLVMALVGVFGVFVFVVPLFNSADYNEADIPDEASVVSSAPAPSPKNNAVEVEARNMYENARQVAKNGKPADSVTLLKRLIASYPKSKSAELAKEAIARPTRNPPLPLFLDESQATVVASNAATNSKKRVEPADPTVAAVDASRPPSGRPSTTAAEIERPANPEDPNSSKVATQGATAAGTVVTQTLPPGFRPNSEAGVHPSGWPLQIVSDRDGGTMCFVPAGVFKMGRDDGQPEEAPLHSVNLSPYYIDQHEITVRQYNLFLKETGQRTVSATSLKKDGAAGEFSPDHPIVGVSLREAASYCEWAGKRLPTESQWEKAARTTDARPYPWGASPPTWIKPRQSKQIDRVMSYELDQSPYGVFDMAGNAWEWTADFYDPRYFQQFKTTTADNPLGPPARSKLPQVTIKGGSKIWHVSWREGLKAETKYPFLGFRGVLAVAGYTPPPTVTAPAPTRAATPGTPVQPTPRGRPAPATGGVVPF